MVCTFEKKLSFYSPISGKSNNSDITQENFQAHLGGDWENWYLSLFMYICWCCIIHDWVDGWPVKSKVERVRKLGYLCHGLDLGLSRTQTNYQFSTSF